jgi:hypothetical protein
VKVSFGQGGVAHIPWISFLIEPNKTSEGIYPVYLYYKEFQLLILAYGVSETIIPLVQWKLPENTKTIREYFKENFSKKPERYGSSFIHRVYDVNNLPDEKTLEADLIKIIEEYKLQFTESKIEKVTMEKNKFSINDSENENEFSDYSFKNLFITYSRAFGEKEGKLTIHQNIRKNYINYKGLNVFKDLNYQDFVEIINLYANEFEIPREIFWKASITQLELGVNLKFKMHISSIISSFSQLKRVQKRFLVDNSALYFKAKKFEIVAYDKLDRASEQKEVFPKASKIKRKKLVNKISKNNSILRFELKIKSLSCWSNSSMYRLTCVLLPNFFIKENKEPFVLLVSEQTQHL